MTRALVVIAVAVVGGCQLDAPSTSSVVQDGIHMQGMHMQGIHMQGIHMQGMHMQGFELGGATMSGVGLDNVHVDKGEVVADLAGVTLHGTSLIGGHFMAQAQDSATPPGSAQVEYRITDVTTESPANDPTGTGSTYLYTLEQLDSDDGSWVTACDPDPDGISVAIPVAAVFDEHGDRTTPADMFTFACTSGVIAKCYRWGYRPWVTGYGDLADMHWTCTRLARADYCGNGNSHTHDGTMINQWDTLPAPGPIQTKAGLLQSLGMIFEAGWNHTGAVCLSRARWLLDDGQLLAAECPDHLIPLGLGATVCDTVQAVLSLDPHVKMFNQSYLNL